MTSGTVSAAIVLQDLRRGTKRNRLHWEACRTVNDVLSVEPHKGEGDVHER
jgi:hypothetical protein